MSTQGVLVDQDLLDLHVNGGLLARTPLIEGQVQPASLDLRLGPVAYRIQAGFLPGASRTVAECIDALSMAEIDLTRPQLLERGAIYIVPLEESLKLPADVIGSASPKSTTGRLDIFVRLITDRATTYDTLEAGYNGPLYLEISPLTFPIIARQGDRLTQLRLRRGTAVISDDELKELHENIPLLYPEIKLPLLSKAAQVHQGLWISIDLHGDPTEVEAIIGYRARHHTRAVDLSRIGGYDWKDFWEPIFRTDCRPLVLHPEEFYIFCSQQGVCIPPSHAAELVAYDTRVGEIRVHYAGFFDPGWGFNPPAGPHGTTAVLEVRAHDVPCVLEHGQPIGRFLYEKLSRSPAKVYGSAINSNYAGQGLKLAKQFRME